MRRSGKLLLAVVAITVIAGTLIRVLQARIGMALVGSVAEARAGRDATAGLPDGLHVALCGSGSPLPDPGRAGPCTLVIAGSRLFVVDTGEGSSRKLAAMGMPVGRIAGVFLTHFHSDHIDGLGPLMLLRWTGSSAVRPLPIHGPTGVEQVVAGFNAAYGLDNGYRTGHHGAKIVTPGGAGGTALPFAIGTAPVVVLDDGGLRITAFPVNHDPVRPAVGYRFDYKGRAVVFSGDTAASASLNRAARGADLMVHEALQPAMVKAVTDVLVQRGQANVAQITRDIIGYHSTPEIAADSARAAGVRQLVLNHLVPPLPFRFAYPAFLGDAASHFGGPIIVGEDGMMFSLPAGSTAITQKDLL
jgi:ribonuclease Z